MSEIKKTKRRSPSPPPPRDQAKAVSSSIRERVLNAAFSLFREHGFSSTSMLEQIANAKAGFRSLSEAIDTTNPAGRMMLQMLGSFAEFERAMLRERTKIGLEG